MEKRQVCLYLNIGLIDEANEAVKQNKFKDIECLSQLVEQGLRRELKTVEA